MGTVTIGVDVGQKIDPTAIAVAEHERRPRLTEPGSDEHHLIRHLERLPLGTPYPQVAERITAIVAGIGEQTGSTPAVWADATGVGQPVVDLLSASGVRVIPCYFTHGDRRIVELEGRQVKIGKAWLVSRLQALLQTGCIHLPNTAEARVLAQELLDYEIKVSEDANEKYGAFRVGSHDDLVTALGLAVQESYVPAAAAMSDGPLDVVSHYGGEFIARRNRERRLGYILRGVQ